MKKAKDRNETCDYGDFVREGGIVIDSEGGFETVRKGGLILATVNAYDTNQDGTLNEGLLISYRVIRVVSVYLWRIY